MDQWPVKRPSCCYTGICWKRKTENIPTNFTRANKLKISGRSTFHDLAELQTTRNSYYLFYLLVCSVKNIWRNDIEINFSICYIWKTMFSWKETSNIITIAEWMQAGPGTVRRWSLLVARIVIILVPFLNHFFPTSIIVSITFSVAIASRAHSRLTYRPVVPEVKRRALPALPTTKL